MRQNKHFPSFFVGKKKKIKKRRASIVVKTSASKGRPRRGRISITAGEESEANVTCGFSQLSRQDVLEEGEHKRAVQIPHMFALFEDDSTIIMGDRRLRSLRLLNQRLLIFALFLLWQATKSSARTAFACGGLKTIETIGTIFFLACKQTQEGETDCPYCLYCLLKKTRGRKTTLLFCFLFSVSCVFYITGFSQLYFIYWLFSIILVFPNCILYIGFSQLYWFFPIVFYILAFLNYIVFSQLSLFSSCKLSYEEDGTCGAFLYDVDKGAGGVKLYMLWLFRG